MSRDEDDDGLFQDLVGVLPREALARSLQAVLGVTAPQANAITRAFDQFVASPLKGDLARLHGHDLARRNPMIDTARGTVSVDEWVDRVLEGEERSAIEARLGGWLEEVARIVSGGTEPGNGVHLQIADDRGIQLYAIQVGPGSWKADVAALKEAAKPLRASGRHVDLHIAVLFGRAKTGRPASEPEITVLGPHDFWLRVSGLADVPARLLKASMILSALVKSRTADEVARIKREANALYGDSDGHLNPDGLAAPPPRRRRRGKRAAS